MSTTRGANDENKEKKRKEKKRKEKKRKEKKSDCREKPTDLILYFLINIYIQKLENFIIRNLLVDKLRCMT